MAIQNGTFRFAEVFPNHSKKAIAKITELEKQKLGLQATPDQVKCGDFFTQWIDLTRNSGRVKGRTLHSYKSLTRLYLIPFFGNMTFAQLNKNVFDRFIGWARECCYRGKPLANKSINKCFTVLKMICESVAIEYGWKSEFSPFFGFRNLSEDDPYEHTMPFTLEEIGNLLKQMTEHWRPYFLFAFCSGLRQGEQIALKPEDIDWEHQIINIRRAITLDENGNRVEGQTKNRYSRRKIKLLPVMLEALLAQKEIYDRFKCEYFFCTPTGTPIDPANLRKKVWEPALKQANIIQRQMRQTRHSFATLALSCGANPLWLHTVLGHRDIEMIIKVYMKYNEKSQSLEDSGSFNNAFQVSPGKDG